MFSRPDQYREKKNATKHFTNHEQLPFSTKPERNEWRKQFRTHYSTRISAYMHAERMKFTGLGIQLTIECIKTV
jgi:hypothetical protein